MLHYPPLIFPQTSSSYTEFCIDYMVPETRFSGATHFLDGASKAAEYTYDASGYLLQRTHHPFGSLNPLGGLMPLSMDLAPDALSLLTPTDTLSYCGPFEYANGTLSRVNFPGGYVKEGVAYHYIHDHQGNVRQVVEATPRK